MNWHLDVIDSPKADFSETEEGRGLHESPSTVACYPEIEVKDYKGVEIEAVKQLKLQTRMLKTKSRA